MTLSAVNDSIAILSQSVNFAKLDNKNTYRVLLYMLLWNLYIDVQNAAVWECLTSAHNNQCVMYTENTKRKLSMSQLQ